MKKIIIISGLLLAFSSVTNAQTEQEPFVKLNEASLISYEDTYQYALEYADWLDRNSTVCTANNQDNKISNYAKRLESIIKNIPDVRNFFLDIKAVHNEELSIATNPSGNIRISTGLMDKLSDDQLLAITACEIYHSQQKTNVERFRQVMSQPTIKNKNNKSALEKEVNLLTHDQLLKLDELYKETPQPNNLDIAADSYAYELLERIGKDPRLVASTLTTMAKLRSTSPASISLSKLDERLQELEYKYIDNLNNQLVQQRKVD